MQIWHYFDYKSPYAYLAQEDTLALADLADVELVIRPYTLHIPSYLGSAEVDGDGKVLHEERNAHHHGATPDQSLDQSGDTQLPSALELSEQWEVPSA